MNRDPYSPGAGHAMLRHGTARTRGLLAVLFAAFAPVLIANRPVHADELDVPEEVRQAMREILACGTSGQCSSSGPVTIEQWDETQHIRREEFDKKLDHLAELLKDDLFKKLSELAGRRIEYNLACIARDRRERPYIYVEITHVFGKHVKSQALPAPVAHVTGPPSVHAPYDTEKYRLAWEYCMLAPWDRPIQTMMAPSPRPITALERIKNDDSLPVLAFGFRAELLRRHCVEGEENRDTCISIFVAMYRFRSRAAVDAMLYCLHLIEAFDDTVDMDTGSTPPMTYRQFVQRPPVKTGR